MLSNLILTQYNGVYGISHIIYMVLCILLFLVSLICIKKYVKEEKTINKIIKTTALVLLIMIILNRISVTYYDVVVNKRDGYTWLNLIPNSFCGLSSLVLSLSVLFLKKDNKILHCISYLGFLGGFLTFFYPDFLDTQSFFDIRSITGLLHHTIMVYLIVLMILTKYFVPSLKKWHIYPIGMCIIMTFAIFLKDALGFSKSFQINEPLLKSSPVLTSWYIVGIISIILQILFIFIYEHLNNKKGEQK